MSQKTKCSDSPGPRREEWVNTAMMSKHKTQRIKGTFGVNNEETNNMVSFVTETCLIRNHLALFSIRGNGHHMQRDTSMGKTRQSKR